VISIDRPLTLLFIVLAFLVLTAGVMFTQRPGCDEAWFGGPAYNLAFHGYMGTPALEPKTSFEEGRNLKGIDRYTYWIMPLNPVVQAGWYQIVGFSLWSMRMLSLLFGLVALAALYLLLRSFELDSVVATVAVALIALDYPFVRSASHGRMDMMCAALNFCAMAAYGLLRKRSLTQAILVANCFAALSCLAHPNGIFGFLGWGVLAVVFDRRKLSLRNVLPGAIPYAVAVLAWYSYIAKAPDLFAIQFGGNTANRFWSLHEPLRALLAEVKERYIGASGGGAVLKALLLIPYIIGIGGVVTTPSLRKQPFLQAILLIAAGESVYFWLMEGTKLYLYIVHTVPLFLMLFAVWVMNAIRQNRLPRAVVFAAFGIWLVLQGAGVSYVMYRNSYGSAYLPAVRYLTEHAAPADTVMGSAELGFSLGFDRPLVDDVKLGFKTGKRPDFVVMEQRYREWLTAYARERDPETYAYIQRLLRQDMHMAYQHNGYEIYARRK
jgi:4-amino-4-deoxy-L-arabinose transferase-like glycosyltransferase